MKVILNDGYTTRELSCEQVMIGLFTKTLKLYSHEDTAAKVQTIDFDRFAVATIKEDEK